MAFWESSYNRSEPNLDPPDYPDEKLESPSGLAIKSLGELLKIAESAIPHLEGCGVEINEIFDFDEIEETSEGIREGLECLVDCLSYYLKEWGDKGKRHESDSTKIPNRSN